MVNHIAKPAIGEGRLRIAIVIIASAVVVAPYIVALSAPGVAHSGDDATYIVMAKAIAEGHGYRIISSPDEPPQTKYPPVFPALLACIWVMVPDFPGNAGALKLIPLAATVLWCLAVWKLMDEISRTRAGGWIALLLAFTPIIVFLSVSVLSDTLFGFFSVAAMLWIRRAETPHSFSTVSVLTGALFASLAFNTRTAGIAVIIAGVLALAIKRRYLASATFAGVCSIACSPWLVWQLVNGHAAASMDRYSSLASYYRDWNIVFSFTPSEKLSVIAWNLIYFLIAPSQLFGLPPNPLVLVLGLMPITMTMLGFVADARRGLGVIHIYSVLYMGMLLLWAFPPFRFLSALLPFMFWFAFRGLQVLFTFHRLASAVSLCGLLILMGIGSFLQCRSTLDGGVFPASGLRWNEFLNLMESVKRVTGPQDRLAGIMDGALFLFTGRQSFVSFELDPMDAYASRESQDSVRIESLARRIASRNITAIVDTPNTTAVQSRLMAKFENRYRAAIRINRSSSTKGYGVVMIDRDKFPNTHQTGPGPR